MRHLTSKISLLSILFANQAMPQSITYFSKDIDYWNDGHSIGSTNPSQHHHDNENPQNDNPSQIRSLDAQPFNWKNYIGDKAIEKASFWDDGGNYIPPLPFRELAANPTQENAKNFITWLNKKNSVITDVNKVLSENNENKIQTINTSSNINNLSTQDEKENKIEKIDWKNATIVYFYSSTCPHCRKEKSVIDYLIKLGAKITPVQIDFGDQAPVYENSIPFDKKLASDFQVKSVPKIFLKYNNSVIVFDGETSIESIINSINI